MFRFPNPGSDINRFIRVFSNTFCEEPDAAYSIDDISYIMAANNSASAVGSIGEKAFHKSQNKNKSLNSIYNQAKSYVELYRWLGWLYASDLKNVKLTAIGKIIVSGVYDVIPIFTTCFVCWNTPNKNINSSSNYKGYPVLNILVTALSLNGKINRDEIIVGPLNEQYSEIGSSVKYINEIRNGSLSIENELQKNSIKVTTQRNYTRLLLSGLRYSGLMKKEKNEYVLTEKGEKIVRENFFTEEKEKIASESLLSLEDENNISKIKSAFYSFLKNSNFDVSNLKSEPIKVFGSPYQVFNPSIVDKVLLEGKLLPENLVTDISYSYSKTDNKQAVSYNQVDDIVTNAFLINEDKVLLQEYIENQTRKLLINNSVEELIDIIKDYKKDKFYPFIGDLFEIIGFKVNVSPNGQNAQRADIVLNYKDIHTIPVEVKSKTEIPKINIKSIEQAIENKIILESRKYLQSRRSDSSFVVGFDYPMSTRENDLINACSKVYGIKIVLFSARTLITMAKEVLESQKKWDIENLITGKGRIEVE